MAAVMTTVGVDEDLLEAPTHLEKREVGNEAVWSLSSAKPGNGKIMPFKLTMSRFTLHYSSTRHSHSIDNLKCSQPGIEQIRDCNIDTFWQSDGNQVCLNMSYYMITRM
jgi:hypothetical protein